MALDVFFKIDTITGESRDAANKGQIDVLAWSWGMSQSGTTHMGSGGGSGKANFQDLSFTKYIDSASNALMVALASGKHIPTATLTVRKAGGSALDYVVILLSDVIVTSLSIGGSGGEDRFTESVTLNFAKVSFKYQPQDTTGSKQGGTKDFVWDIAGNKAA